MTKKKKFLDLVREKIRLKDYSFDTERVYIYRIKEFILFNNKKHPKTLGAKEIKNYLSWLAINKQVSPSTQNQALSAIVFLYKHILNQDIGDISSAYRAKNCNYIPTTISREEILKIIDSSRGVYRLMIVLLYGCGLRINELFNLRIEDINIKGKQIRVYQRKGKVSRSITLPELAIPLLKIQIAHCRKEWEEDRRLNYNGVETPYSIQTKYSNDGKDWNLFWLFPAQNLSRDPRSGVIRRHHLHKSTLQKHFKAIREKLKITTKITPHCLRHCFATHSLEDGIDINTVQRLLGHMKIQTTMIYLYALESINGITTSPLDNIVQKRLSADNKLKYTYNYNREPEIKQDASPIHYIYNNHFHFKNKIGPPIRN